MRVVLQRVQRAAVAVDGREVAAISQGLCALVGIEIGDGEQDIAYCAGKLCSLRIFDDERGQMNLSVAEVGGEILLVSQFTLLADARKGRRPSYSLAAPPEAARDLFERFVARVRATHPGRVATGVFQAEMEVALVNHGPVTILLDSRKI